MQHFQTAAEDRIPFIQKVIYGAGAFVNNILAAAIGGMVIVLNLSLGMNPALVGLIGALPRLTDALTDPLMGYISDNTRSRWGRRRPWIFIGAILVGVTYMLLWQLPLGKSEDWYFYYFLIGSFIFYLAYTIFATPWVALGYELTPDYHERTRLMGVQSFMGSFAYVISPWFLWFMQLSMFEDEIQGAAWLAIAIGIVAIGLGVLPAIFLRERFKTAHVAEEGEEASAEEKLPLSAVLIDNIKQFVQGFVQTMTVKPFLLLCAATFLVFNGFMLIAAFGFYVIIYYVYGGDQELGATYAGWQGSIGAISSFFVIIFVTWLSTRIGKRRTFFIAMTICMFGHAIKWWCYQPDNIALANEQIAWLIETDFPWLLMVPAVFFSFGLGSLFTLMSSMIADVCDYDELNTHARREGMFGSIYWWVVKLGMALALAAGGFLLNFTGFDVALEGNQTEQAIFLMRFFDVVVPVITTGLAFLAVYFFPITEERAHEIRLELEARRGAV